MGLFSGKRPSDIGLNNKQLKNRPKTPNCVLSQGDRSNIEAFDLGDDPKAYFEAIVNAVKQSEGAIIVENNDHYIHAECRTPLMGYVDDLEFYWAEEENVAHVRSASRLGRSDLGKNRQRVEGIRKQLG